MSQSVMAESSDSREDWEDKEHWESLLTREEECLSSSTLWWMSLVDRVGEGGGDEAGRGDAAAAGAAAASSSSEVNEAS